MNKKRGTSEKAQNGKHNQLGNDHRSRTLNTCPQNVFNITTEISIMVKNLEMAFAS